MISPVLFESKNQAWGTPQKLFDKLNEEFHFTLDPCANIENHKCEKYYTIEQDGLFYDWANERVFCNPPYGRAVGEWVEKSYWEAKKGALVVMLISSRTDTRWWHNFIEGVAEVRFIKGRLKFQGAKNSAPFPSCIVIFKNENQPKRKHPGTQDTQISE